MACLIKSLVTGNKLNVQSLSLPQRWEGKGGLKEKRGFYCSNHMVGSVIKIFKRDIPYMVQNSGRHRENTQCMLATVVTVMILSFLKISSYFSNGQRTCLRQVGCRTDFLSCGGITHPFQ